MGKQERIWTKWYSCGERTILKVTDRGMKKN